MPKSTPATTDSENAADARVSDGGSATTNQNGASAKATNQPVNVDANVRVSVSVLDRLMNLAGELVLGRNQLLQTIARRDTRALDSIGAGLDRVTSELQEAIMETRMQPIGNVFNKFTRIVRDLSHALGKQCELTIEGKDVELDKTIIEAIGDPLTHLIRNSADHGIESPDERSRNGKNPVGRIILRAFHQEGKINICIEDDGAGIDTSKLKEKAIATGVITADQAQTMGDREAVRLIFHPGLSTAEELSDVSGRGVRMDVVRSNLERIGGSVEVETELGAGTKIRIKLPLTLAIIPSLVIRCGDERYAIPQVSISELVRIRPGEIRDKIQRVNNAEVLRLRGSLLPLVRLSATLGFQSTYADCVSRVLEPNRRIGIADRREQQTDQMPKETELRDDQDRREDTVHGALNIIVVETGHMRYGLIVDGLHDSEEIVVKPLGRHMAGCCCLSGATVLGDGRVALILDARGIASYADLQLLESRDRNRSVSMWGKTLDFFWTCLWSRTKQATMGMHRSRDQQGVTTDGKSRTRRGG